MGKMAVRLVCVCGDFVNWPGVHGADWVKPKTALHTDIPTVHKTPLGTGMGCVCLSGQHGVWFLVVAGEWWWASNECASLPKEGPLGPVLKWGHSRMWVTRWATASKCSDVTRFGTCVAVPGCGKIDKMLMERVYGGHIMVHQPWKGGC